MSATPAAAPQVRPPLQDFDTEDVWPWITSWLKATCQTDLESLVVPADKKHAFATYPATGEQGRYDLSPMLAPDGPIGIALAGDWGTGTDVSQQGADSIAAANPELTIHLRESLIAASDGADLRNTQTDGRAGIDPEPNHAANPRRIGPGTHFTENFGDRCQSVRISRIADGIREPGATSTSHTHSKCAARRP